MDKTLYIEAGESLTFDVLSGYNFEQVKVFSSLPVWFTNNTDINGFSQQWVISPPIEGTFTYTIGIYEDPDIGYLFYDLTIVVSDVYENIDVCCDNQLNIVWFNRHSGYRNFIFTQRKDYQVRTGDTRTFITDGLLKYSERGRQYNAVIAYATGLSENQIESISTLRYAIQAWVYNPSDRTFDEIILDSGDFDKYSTRKGLKQLQISFRYAKELKVQRQ